VKGRVAVTREIPDRPLATTIGTHLVQVQMDYALVPELNLDLPAGLGRRCRHPNAEMVGIDELRDIELARLDALQVALWPRVEKGEVRAVNSVMRIIDRRCRILGLYPQRARSEKSFDTLVIQDPGNPGEATDADGDELEEDVDAIPAA
jgi:hypothetical protein